ncbi:MAG: alanine--tRNA ligase [Planctomycetes bacterium]|nr:alanine--tRNA ligase [Planctomycetota bacterium]
MPKFLSTDEIRRRFIAFYVSKGHKHMPADSLVPQNDKSVLFTGAGMNQFKDHFLGRAKLDHPRQRAVTVQPCVRTADIENVGRTPNHHACFEMLGNFSFGDYFKNEAIQWAAEFLLDPDKGLGLEKERLSVTVYGGNAKLGIKKDEEALMAWRLHAPWLKDEHAPGGWRIYEYGDHDNYWPADAPEQGPNGPSGPCSEIYFDMFPNQGAPERVAESRDPFRYCEIWNLVFTQFNRVGVGKLEPLPSRNIDTGSGLERVARVIQGQPNNYETDHLIPIVKAVSKLCGKEYGKEFEHDRRMRRITDHVRFAVFAIADGVSPKNEGRNYVVRRLIRRAILDGQELGISEPFIGGIAKHVIQQMSVGYPDLTKRQDVVVRILEEEEKAFNRTIVDGRRELDKCLCISLWQHLKNNPDSKFQGWFPIASRAIKDKFFDPLIHPDTGQPLAGFSSYHQLNPQDEMEFKSRTLALSVEWSERRNRVKEEAEIVWVRGVAAFRMWDTFGFPVELTEELSMELGFAVQKAEFADAMAQSIERSRSNSSMATEIFGSGPVQDLKAKYAGKPTKFDGYGKISLEGAAVLALLQVWDAEKAPAGGSVQRSKLVESMDGKVFQDAVVLLDRTPFYAESGGQVSDRGRLVCGGVDHQVVDMKKDGGLFFHAVKLGGPLKVGDIVTAIVEDEGHRRPTQRNHSATHLLHHALRKTLGSHVEQRGSLVAPDRLRFDFTHFEAITPEQLQQIESCVNHLVRHDVPVETAEKPIAEAKAMGAMALFGEKYGDVVRVVQMGPSTELCGGTHVGRTGEIGYFRIVSEGSVSAGVRRVEALTGQAAVDDARAADTALATVAAQLKTKRDGVLERLKALSDEKAALERELESFKKKAANAAAGDLLTSAKDVKGAKLVAASLDGQDAVGLRTTLDGIRKKLPEGAVVLGGAKDGKVALLVSLSPELVKRGGHAGNLLKELAQKVGGKGGGKPDMAQGGGTDASKLPEALAAAEILLSAMLK